VITNFDAVSPRVVDVRLLFDIRAVAVTLSIPMEMLEDEQNEVAALSLIAKLIRMVPHLKDSVLQHKKLSEVLSTQGRTL
jgi:hypothetical protein